MENELDIPYPNYKKYNIIFPALYVWSSCFHFVKDIPMEFIP